MLFSPEPKSLQPDYFNYRAELDVFERYLSDDLTKLIAIKGLRRTGKTSFALVSFSKLKKKHILIDARSLEAPTRQALEKKMIEEFRKAEWIPKKLLDSVTSVEFGVKVGFTTATKLWDYLRKEEVVIFIDEAQVLKGSGADSLLAAIYDGTRVKLVLSGSEVGVLEDFLGQHDAKAPLFGRAFAEIQMKRLSAEKSLEFLKKGFEQAGKKPSETDLSEAVGALGGVIGWLTLYGNNALKTGHHSALKRTLATGELLVHDEFEKFLSFRMAAKTRYVLVLQAISKGFSSWSDIRDYLATKENAPVSDPQLANFLSSLADYGFIIKENERYLPADPVIRKAWQ